MPQQLPEYSLPLNGYASFDALTLKRYIIDRLNTNSKFTDQNFEGSNLSSIIDILGFTNHVLLMYLNQTGNETLFSSANLYENINRIVKTTNYGPVGVQTPALAFTAEATENISTGVYTIPRFSFINAGESIFSFNQDVTFVKTATGAEVLTNFSDNNLLYQGTFEEYPLQTALGDLYEIITLIPGDDILIDYFNVYVFVKPVRTGKWEEWKRVNEFINTDSDGAYYKVRYNENKRIEITFGNDITSKKLERGDTVAIYYLKSNGTLGEVGINALNGNVLTFKNTVRFNEIFTQIKEQVRYIRLNELGYINFSNNVPSSFYYSGETVEDIRTRAPKAFYSQNRLITEDDFTNFILRNFSNIIIDSKVVGNDTYINEHLRYQYEVTNKKPQLSPEVANNHVLFADSCDFNNVYIYCVPNNIKRTSVISRNNYLSTAQRNIILNRVTPYKSISLEPIIVDPVYVAVDIAIGDEAVSSASNSILRVVKEKNSQKSSEDIQASIVSIFTTYFTSGKLGQVVDVTSIVNQILNVEGVKDIYTESKDGTLSYRGLSLIIWNPVYSDSDITLTTSNITLPYFKYAYLYDSTNLINRIKVENDGTTQLIESL